MTPVPGDQPAIQHEQVETDGNNSTEVLLEVWAWRHRAACRNADLLTFFGPEGERARERVLRERRAKAICARCPVVAPCAVYALTHREPYGIWGGLSERERRRLWPEPPTGPPSDKQSAGQGAAGGRQSDHEQGGRRRGHHRR